MRLASSTCSASSLASTSSRQLSKSAKPRSRRRESPRSSHTVRLVSDCRKRRSWLISTKAERSDLSSASSHSMAGRSRWLVGSSSSSTSGCGASVRAMAARRISPPDRRFGSSSPREAQLAQKIGAAVRIIRRAEAPFHIVQHGLVGREVRLLRQVADGGAGLHPALALVGLDHAGGDLEQRRLARAVAPDQRHALALGHGEFGVLENGTAAEGEADAAKVKKDPAHDGAGCRAFARDGKPSSPLPALGERK